MKKTGKEIVYSPSDLIRFMESPFASWMERCDLERPGELERDPEDAETKLVADAGNRHEASFLAKLRDDGRDLCEIERGPDAFAQTARAIKEKREVIFQAALRMDSFSGFADFLVLGDDGSYEVWDTKLARKTKPYFLVQLCCYSEMLEAVQGKRPEIVRVILGTNEEMAFRTDEHFHYYLSLKEGFLGQMEAWDPESPPEPKPGADHRDWSGEADKWMIERDHLSLVASLRSTQVKRLHDAGVLTVGDLSTTELTRVKGMADATLDNLKAQARLQVATRKRREEGDEFAPPVFEIRPPKEEGERRGLALLPPASPLDVYFDLEGFPMHDGGLEYLWGATHLVDGGPEFKDWWAHDHEQEEKAFVDFMDWVTERWRRDPSMRIYHYAPYEKTALRRIAGRCGKRENELDDLLRNEVFVDLYQVVRQGLVIGEPSYSIKKVELIYRDQREGEVSTSMGSVVAYADWMNSGQPGDWKSSPLLESIRDYNKDDCDSTWELAEWLRELQVKEDVPYIPTTREQEEPAEEVDPEKAAAIEARRRLVEALLEEAENSEDEEVGTISGMLAHVLDFHRREDKPGWWELFDWNEKEADELVDDPDCLGDLRRDGTSPEKVGKSTIFRYVFDNGQESKVERGKYAKVAGSLYPVMVEELDPRRGTVRLKVGDKTLAKRFGGNLPETLSLLPHEQFNPKVLVDAIESVARAWLEERDLPPALRDFLLRSLPGVKGLSSGSPLLPEDDDKVDPCKALLENLDSSALCIQGPPGAGKTYLASKAINHLLARGKRVGVSSNSHKAILNLLAACDENGTGSFSCIKVGPDKDDPFYGEHPGARHYASPKKAVAEYDGGLVGGTAWLFSRDDLAGKLDYLFVDEAGQVSVANLVAMSRSAANLVLVGDQMQLEQPTRGAHPGDSGDSILDYYLRDESIVPPERGVFLDVTWRLHPGICDFISESFYEGKLKPRPENAERVVKLPADGGDRITKEAGIVFVPVEHLGNSRSSEEEADAIVRLVEELSGRTHLDEKGKVVGELCIEDVLFVSPYNAQVRRLRDALPEGARVGSVDKFQGQEAPVVIVSLCASEGETGPRGIDFLLNRHRVNVAVSRARSLAVVVGDPRVARSPASTIDQMACLNLLCRLRAEA